MRKLVFFLALGAAWGEQPTPARDQVVLTVGGEKVTQSRFERFVGTLSTQSQEKAKTPEGRRQLAERIAQVMVLAREARARRLDKAADVPFRLEIQADQALAEIMLQTLGTPNESDLRGYYETHKAEWEEARIQQVLVRFRGSPVPLRPGQKDRTEEEALVRAQSLRARITAGARFIEIAAAESDDTDSGSRGGDMGSFSRSTIIAELEDAAFSLPDGQVSDPIRSPFGYHLIVVETRTIRPLEEVRPMIEANLRANTAQKAIDALITKAGVVLDEAYFGK